jgi:RNase H-fold protein (predicted Holliday junction resolvase)
VFGVVNANQTKHTSEKKSLFWTNQYLRYQNQSTMTTTDEFSASLVRCGFAKEAAEAIIAEGLSSIKDFAATPSCDVDELLKHINKNKPEGVIFPMIAMQKMKAYKFFIDYRVNTAQSATADLWKDAVITDWYTKLSTVLATIEGEEKDKPSRTPLSSPISNNGSSLRTRSSSG